MKLLELPLPRQWPDKLDEFTRQLDQTLLDWALALEDSAKRISGAEVFTEDADGNTTTLEDYSALYSDHDKLIGVSDSTAHLLFLLLDGTRPMTGNLDMALNAINNVSALDMDGDITMNEHVIDDIGTLNFDHVIGGYTYDLNITTATVLSSYPGLQYEWTRSGYTATGLLGPQYRTIDSVPQHLWVMASGLYIYNAAGEAGTGSIYLASGQFVSFIETGTAPIKILSTTMCPNLNADLLDGYEGAAFAALAENELITGDWTFGGSAKAYFNDASALGGTEFITAAVDTKLDYHAGVSHRFFKAAYDVMDVEEDFTGYALVKFPVGGLFYAGGQLVAGVYSTDFRLFKFLEMSANTYIIQKDFSDPQGGYFAGDDADCFMGYDGSNMILDPNRVGAGKVYIGLTADDDLACGGLQVNSGMQLEQATISAAATLTAAHYIVICDTDTAGAAFTVTLPAAASHADRVYYIKNTGTGGFDVTVDGDGAETIDGDATQTVIDGHCLAIVCDGTEWWVI